MSISTEIIKAKRPSRIKITVSIMVILLSAWLAWDMLTPPKPPVEVWVEPEQSKIIADVPKEVITPKALKVYSKKAKSKLNLSPAMQQDDNQYVISATTLKHDYHPQTVVTTANVETGESTTIYRREPYPWFTFQQTGEARIDYGIKNGGRMVGRLTLREDLIQIKGVNIGATATLDSDASAFVGVGAGWRW